MSNNNYDDSDITGYRMPSNPKMNIGGEEEEVYRKIAPTMIMPSLGPMPAIPMGMLSSSSAIINTVNMSPTKAASPSLEKQSLQQLRNESSTPFSWKVCAVPVLPEFHTLERSATFVPRANASEVSSRISDILRERSIEAQYENGKAKVKCTTVEGVDFCIRLYRGRGRYHHGIIVEVQRRFGTSMIFHSDTKAILDVVRGKTPTPPPPMASHLPEVSEDDDDNEDYQVTPSASAESSLKMVAKMMKLSGFDSQYLGLQTLSPLVDSERLSMSTARAVARSLFQPGSEVGNKVFGYIIGNSNKTPPNVTKRGVFEEEDDDEEDETLMVLRNMCLNILANATKAYGKVPNSFVRESLRPILIEDLNNAEKHPNTAFLSAKCLEHFVPGDHNTTELNRAFRVALMTGESKHANLMRQAQKCIDATDASINR